MRLHATTLLFAGATLGALALGGCARAARHDPTDAWIHADSVARDAVAATWGLERCAAEARRASGGKFPATESALLAQPRCGDIAARLAKAGGRVAYAPVASGEGYTIRATGRAPDGAEYTLFTEVAATDSGMNGLVHLHAGTEPATHADPVTASILPALATLGLCLENGQQGRETGNHGYVRVLREIEGVSPGCVESAGFRYTADSNVVSIRSGGAEYLVSYASITGCGDSISDFRNGRWELQAEWVETDDYTLSARPAHFGETGVRSYRVQGQRGMAFAALDSIAPADSAGSYAPVCEYRRLAGGCEPQRPAADGSRKARGWVALFMPERDY